MNTQEQQAILSIALFAAFADGANADAEREHIRRLAESLRGDTDGLDIFPLYQKVLLKQIKLSDVARSLSDPGHQQLAYEIAVGVCDADGATSATERNFLTALAGELRLNQATSATLDHEAETMAALTTAAAPLTVPAAPVASPTAAATRPLPDNDGSILNHAILAGALELLPQSWASMAIIPLQIKLVYGIGKAHGYALDQGHIRELLATVGIGLTSQYLEQFGRKLIGGLLGKAMGSMAKGIGKAGTSMAFSFASTYALGQLADRYYAGGRTMSSQLLKDTFQGLLGPAKSMQTQYLPQIRERAQNLDIGQITQLVRGGI